MDDYLATVSKPERDCLEHVRSVIHAAAPEAEEVISYGMPVFKHRGKYLAGFCAFKDHMGLFPGPEPITQLTGKLHKYELAKGTIRFTLDNPLSDELIREIIAVCLVRTADKK